MPIAMLSKIFLVASSRFGGVDCDIFIFFRLLISLINAIC